MVSSGPTVTARPWSARRAIRALRSPARDAGRGGRRGSRGGLDDGRGLHVQALEQLAGAGQARGQKGRAAGRPGELVHGAEQAEACADEVGAGLLERKQRGRHADCTSKGGNQFDNSRNELQQQSQAVMIDSTY